MNSGIRVSRTLFFIGLVTALTFALPTRAVEVSGVKLDDAVRVGNQDLRLNGAGIRYKLIFKIYVAGLYLPEKKTNVPDVLAAPGARRVTIVMLRDVGNEEMARGFLSGIHLNSDRSEKARLVGQLQKFGEVFASIPELKKGDVLTTDWIPGTGTVVHVNGKKVSKPLPDIAFYNALLKIWLGEKPVDSSLKTSLLGQKQEDAPRSGNAY